MDSVTSFLLQVFYESSSPGPLKISNFEFLQKFAEIFTSKGAPPVSMTPVLMLVLSTPVANLPLVPLVLLIPVANCHLCRWE